MNTGGEVQTKSAANWQHGLCGCFDNIFVCLITYFVPCVTLGKNAEAVGENCILYGIAYIVPILNVFCAASIRGKIRDQKGIPGGFGGDCALHCCCPLCALVQDAQEVGWMDAGGQQSIARE